MKTYQYEVNPQHSTVLGYTAGSKYGQKLWAELDWRAVRVDGGQHFFNSLGGQYLHVRCHYDRDQDGPKRIPVSDCRWYRVRCRHEIGAKWRGGIVADIKVKKRDSRWIWVVSVEKQ